MTKFIYYHTTLDDFTIVFNGKNYNYPGVAPPILLVDNETKTITTIKLSDVISKVPTFISLKDAQYTIDVVWGSREKSVGEEVGIAMPFAREAVTPKLREEDENNSTESVDPNYYTFEIFNKNNESIICDVYDIANAMGLSSEQFNQLKYMRVKGDLEKIINDAEKGKKSAERFIERKKNELKRKSLEKAKA